MDFMGRDAREARLQDEAAKAPVAAIEASPAITAALSDPTVQATTAAILADLTAAAEPSESASAAPAAGDDALAKMSAAVLEGLKGGQTTDASLEGMVAQALIDGKTDAAIDEMVNQAVAEGTVEAPPMLTTTEGKVDTAVLLASVVATAQGDEFGQGDVSEPTEVIEGGTQAMLAATEDVLYTVQVDDSLGSLALKFYGDSALYDEIFKANRQVMDTPESLTSGMKLLIPAKSSL
jgi:nucleoid-associated protein YgaU